MKSTFFTERYEEGYTPKSKCYKQQKNIHKIDRRLRKILVEARKAKGNLWYKNNKAVNQPEFLVSQCYTILTP